MCDQSKRLFHRQRIKCIRSRWLKKKSRIVLSGTLHTPLDRCVRQCNQSMPICKVGQCSEALLELLEVWDVGGKCRVPWCVVDALGAPTSAEKYMRWVRSQIYRLNSALTRRYEVRLKAWPYPLACLYMEKFSVEHIDEVITKLLRARDTELHIYARGLRILYPTPADLKSLECRSLVRADMRAHMFGISFVERLNSSLTSGQGGPRAPGRSIPHAFREFFLRQLADVHVSRQGTHPLAPGSLDARPPTELVKSCPLCPVDNGASDTISPPGLLALEDTPADGAAQEQHVRVDAAALPSQSFAEPVIARRPNPDSITAGRYHHADGRGKKGLGSAFTCLRRINTWRPRSKQKVLL